MMIVYMVKGENEKNCGRFYKTMEEAQLAADSLNDIPDDDKYIVKEVNAYWYHG